jgi:hypothetical protein
MNSLILEKIRFGSEMGNPHCSKFLEDCTEIPCFIDSKNYKVN